MYLLSIRFNGEHVRASPFAINIEGQETSQEKESAATEEEEIFLVEFQLFCLVEFQLFCLVEFQLFCLVEFQQDCIDFCNIESSLSSLFFLLLLLLISLHPFFFSLFFFPYLKQPLLPFALSRSSLCVWKCTWTRICRPGLTPSSQAPPRRPSCPSCNRPMQVAIS